MNSTRWTRIALGGAVLTASAASVHGCDVLAAAIPQLGFCGEVVPTMDIAKLATGPSIFIDALRAVSEEVGAQSSQVGTGLTKGFSVQQTALDALGPYQYQGTGAYRRDVASDRAFQLRFFWGDGVSGKAPGAPLEADLTQLSSYLPSGGIANLLNPSAQGPLFPLVQASGLTSGNLQFNPSALKLDLASLLSTTLQGYGLKLSVGTKQETLGSLASSLASGKVPLSLADTAMTNAAENFSLSIKRFDVTYDVNGSAKLGGDYLFQVDQGPLRYLGAVTMVNGSPVASLRCSEEAGSEFATISFAGGKADFKMNASHFPITLPGLAPAR